MFYIKYMCYNPHTQAQKQKKDQEMLPCLCQHLREKTHRKQVDSTCRTLKRLTSLSHQPRLMMRVCRGLSQEHQLKAGKRSRSFFLHMGDKPPSPLAGDKNFTLESLNTENLDSRGTRNHRWWDPAGERARAYMDMNTPDGDFYLVPFPHSAFRPL